MNQIVINSRALDRRAVGPAMSAALAKQIELVSNPHPDIRAPKRFPPAVMAEAASVADAMESLCAPVTLEALRAWVRPIGAAVRNPPSGEDFAAWGAALVVACGDYAAGAFTAATQREALTTFKFFPSVADIAAVVGPKSMALRRKLAMLRTIAEAEPEERRPTPTDAERRAVAAKLAAFRSGLPTGPLPGDGDVKLCERPHDPIRTVDQQLAELGFSRDTFPRRGATQ